VADDAAVRDCVDRARVDAVDHRRRSDSGQWCPGELGRGFHDLCPTMVEGAVFVCHELAVRVDAGPDVRRLGRAELVPAVLVPTHELHPYRLAYRLRTERRGDADVVIGVVAVVA